MGLVRDGGDDRDEIAITRLLEDLAELRELDRKRHAHAPGSAAAASAAAEVDRRSHELMDRFRDIGTGRRKGSSRR